MAFNPIERETFPLEPGETFVLFSDGVSEAMNAAGDFYGEERLLTALSAVAGASAADTVARVLGDVRAFAARSEAIGRHLRSGSALCTRERLREAPTRRDRQYG